MLTVNKLTQEIYDVKNVLETPSKLSLWTILEGADWKKLALALEVEAFQQAFFFLFRSLSLFQLSFAPCPRADHASLLQLASVVDMFPILPVFLLSRSFI